MFDIISLDQWSKIKIVEVKFVQSKNNTSDVMTKNLAEDLFLKHKKSINRGMISYNEKEMIIENNDNNQTK